MQDHQTQETARDLRVAEAMPGLLKGTPTLLRLLAGPCRPSKGTLVLPADDQRVWGNHRNSGDRLRPMDLVSVL